MSNKERSDDVVIKSRPSPIKRIKPLSHRDRQRNMRQLSDDHHVKPKTVAPAPAPPVAVAPVPIPKMEPVKRIRKLDFPKADAPAPKIQPIRQIKKLDRKQKTEVNDTLDEPFIPVPILKHTEREESRVTRFRGPSGPGAYSGALGQAQRARTWSGSESQPPKRRQEYERLEESKPVIDPRFQLMHEQQRDHANLQRLMLTQYTTDRREQRHHLADSERRKYKDRNDERQFELAKMKIEHIEPLTRANIQSRQQSIIEQDAAVARRLHVQAHNHELVQLHQAYCETQKEDRLQIIYREFGIDTYNPDDVYISPPTVESYMIMKRNYTYSHLCIGVKNVVPGNNFIIVELIDGSKHRFNLDDQFYRIENFGSGVVVIRFMRHIGYKENRTLRCPCPNCEIA